MKSYVKVFKDFTLSHASFPLKVIIFWNHFPCVWYHHDGLIFSPLFIIIHGRHAHSAGAERAKKNVLKRRKKGKIYPRHDLAPFLFSGSFYFWLGGDEFVHPTGIDMQHVTANLPRAVNVYHTTPWHRLFEIEFTILCRYLCSAVVCTVTQSWEELLRWQLAKWT